LGSHLLQTHKTSLFVELDPSQFLQVIPGFRPLDFHLAVRSVLQNASSGRIFASSNAALIATRKRFYLAGEPEETGLQPALRDLFQKDLFPALLRAGIGWAVLYFTPSWEEHLLALLQGMETHFAPRQFYRFSGPVGNWRDRLPPGYQIVPVDRDLLVQTHLNHLDLLMDEMGSEGGTPEDFLLQRFGVCAVQGQEIHGWCLSENNLPDACEIGIEVLEPYQRQGLGTQLTAAFIERARLQGVRHIGWDCFARNLPSVAAARKAGFERVCDYPVILCKLEAAWAELRDDPT
jgi:GNAT superfamily N-acetyltransferase